MLTAVEAFFARHSTSCSSFSRFRVLYTRRSVDRGLGGLTLETAMARQTWKWCAMPPPACRQLHWSCLLQVPAHCIPIPADVTTFNWTRLANATQFDVIMLDPPWQLASANPSRGVALGYSQLQDKQIADLPIPALLQNGFVFLWVINAKYRVGLDMLERWGCECGFCFLFCVLALHTLLGTCRTLSASALRNCVVWKRPNRCVQHLQQAMQAGNRAHQK